MNNNLKSILVLTSFLFGTAHAYEYPMIYTIKTIPQQIKIKLMKDKISISRADIEFTTEQLPTTLTPNSTYLKDLKHPLSIGFHQTPEELREVLSEAFNANVVFRPVK